MTPRFQLVWAASLLALAAWPGNAIAQARAGSERGIGPFTMETSRGTLTVRIVRRDAQFVWVDQLTSAGGWIETGLAPKDITRVDMQRPRFFDLVEAASNPDLLAQYAEALKKIADQQKAYRDLPGMLADEAQYLQARILEKQDKWKAALPLYEELAAQKHQPQIAPPARLRAGVCLVRLEQFEKAMPYLEADVTDEDLALLSDAVFARATARSALKQHEPAVLDFLYLVVFHPFVHTNEARCLAGALPNYAALRDWDAVWKSISVLRSQYAALEETKRAEEFVKPYAEEVEKQKDFASP